jgi:hypothetical protein
LIARGQFAKRDALGLALTVAAFASTLGPSSGTAGDSKKKPAAAAQLTRTHHIASSAATFKTPDDWLVGGSGDSPEIVNAEGDELMVRFLRWDNEAGLDSLHVTCLVERLGDVATIDATTHYEYDFQSGEREDWRILDTAYSISYEAPVRGHRDWHQRVITMVGKGQAFCVIAFCPVQLWKRSIASKRLLEAVVSSVVLP